MPGIFISYRRDDSAGHAGRLYDRLVERFGHQQVFMDIDSIEPGTDFVTVLEEAINSCQTVIALIGRDWVGATDDAGGRRLNNPQDFVRLELSLALQRNLRVFPVLVQGASMPLAADLPDDLAALTRRHCVEIRDTRFRADVERLIGTLERAIAPATRNDTESAHVDTLTVRAKSETQESRILRAVAGLPDDFLSAGNFLRELVTATKLAAGALYIYVPESDALHLVAWIGSPDLWERATTIPMDTPELVERNQTLIAAFAHNKLHIAKAYAPQHKEKSCVLVFADRDPAAARHLPRAAQELLQAAADVQGAMLDTWRGTEKLKEANRTMNAVTHLSMRLLHPHASQDQLVRTAV